MTEKQLEELMQFVKQQQQYLGGAIVIQMKHFGAKESVVHTEIINKKIAETKYLVTTIVRPLTKELRDEIIKKTKQK